MNESTIHLSLLIPTRNRRDDLRRLFESLRAQTRKPDHVLLIDGGEDHVDDFARTFPELPIAYLPVYPPGLTKQRNQGIDHLQAQSTLVGFLDDDVELFPDAIEKMLDFWRQAPEETAGASFNVVNNEATKVTWLRKLFLISSERGGAVLPSGFNNVLFPVLRDTETRWLCGGATVWRRSLFATHRFQERYLGYGHFDDLDFCFSLGPSRRFFVLREAKCYHHCHPFRPEKLRAFGASDVVNRYRFVRRFHLPKLAFAWATLGHIIGTLLSGLLRRDRGRLDLAFGSWLGVCRILSGRTGGVEALDLK